MKKDTITPFEVQTVELTGTNLIEASAGTGKTYSITLLVVRLVIEEQIPIQKILMVTFTKAAIAELELRIRKIIREALKLVDEIKNKNVRDEQTDLFHIFTHAMNKKGISIEELGKLLKAADSFLDELSILTIHSFCQRTLSEYAFETGQLFGSTMITNEDQAEIKKEYFNEFWRQYITTMDVELLEILYMHDFNKDSILKDIESVIDGKQISPSITIDLYHLDNTCCDKKWVELLKKIKKHAKDDQAIKQYMVEINLIAAEYVIGRLTDIKKQKGWITFNDMIYLLYEAVALEKGGSKEEKQHSKVIPQALQEKFKAVFVDEFQDTDTFQYAIFKQLFHSRTPVFYIGDPKQSIYGFRKADLNTYFKAKNEVEHVYTMQMNYRSNASLIDAMNYFFQPCEGFDTFLMKDLQYSIVHSPQPNQQGVLKSTDVQKEIPPLLLSPYKNKSDIASAVAKTVSALLSDRYYIDKHQEKKSIAPSDIGILVRTKHEAKTIKAELSHFNIPAIIVDDTKILSTDEAKNILYILKAVGTKKRGDINRALLTTLVGYDYRKLLENENDAVDSFVSYQEIWKDSGVFVMLKQFFIDYGITNKLKSDFKRVISNIQQLLELLHKQERTKKYNPQELTDWLDKAINADLISGDESEQRIESDENAVSIATIHKSKGLEYNIVLAPHLDLKFKKDKDRSLSWSEKGNYYSILPALAEEEHVSKAKQQAEEENRRLIYVAITRAKMQCFIYKSIAKNLGETSLSPFYNAIMNKPLKDRVDCGKGKMPSSEAKYKSNEVQKEPIYAEIKNFKLLHSHWRKTSYTALSLNEHHHISKGEQKEVSKNMYDDFVFYQLARGTQMGTCLHYIFEHIDFGNSTTWKQWVARALNHFSFVKDNEQYSQHILSLLDTMMHTTLSIKQLNAEAVSFCLASITKDCKLSELEFNFSMNLFSTIDLEKYSSVHAPFKVEKSKIEGILNGFIDLFFKYNDRYYILDWKSNHLGYTVDDYSADRIAIAMKENNYHLQYLLYTVAVVRYLSSCLPNFDYDKHFGGIIYVFVRGVRKGTNNGLFLTRPDKSFVDNLNNVFCGLI